MINSVVLIVGSIIVLTKAIPGLFNPGEANAEGMMYLAILGIIVNGAAVFNLRKGKSLNEKVVSLHLLEDVLGWAAILIGSIVMKYIDAKFIDPLLSILISGYVLFNVYKNLKKSLLIILQGIPEDVDLEEISRRLKSIPEVTNVHDCHVWSMDGNYNVLTLHLQLNADFKLSKQASLKEEVKSKLSNVSVHHITVEFEGPDEFCEMKEC